MRRFLPRLGQSHPFSSSLGRRSGGTHISRGAIGACKPALLRRNSPFKQYHLPIVKPISHASVYTPISRFATAAECIYWSQSPETAPMEIEILSMEEVKPASRTPLHLQTYELSLLDQLAHHDYSNLAFFFSHNNQSAMLNDVISKRRQHLKQSLTRTLVHFYPLAGKIKDNLHIDSNEEAVYYTEARVSLRLSDFLRNPENELINRLFAFDPSSEEIKSQTYVTMIQISTFACGGIAIGLSASHKIIDGFTMSTFMNAWASTARESSKQINPYFLSSSLFRQVPCCYTSEYSKLFTDFSKTKCQLDEHNYVTKRFAFDCLSLDALKAKTTTSSPSPSSVTAVMGLLWKSAIAASQVRCGTQCKLSLLIPVNLRTRISPSLPTHSCGNIFWLAYAEQETDSNPELQLLVNCVRNAIASTDIDFVEGMKGKDRHLKLMESLKNYGELFYNPNSEAGIFGMSSICKTGFHEVDFGWGKPVWSCIGRENRNVYGSRVKSKALLMDKRNGDGIEAWVTLNEDDMAIFDKNPELLRFASLNPSPIES